MPLARLSGRSQAGYVGMPSALVDAAERSSPKDLGYLLAWTGNQQKAERRISRGYPGSRRLDSDEGSAMIALDYPKYFNCLFFAWWRFRVRPYLLIRKRGWKGWRARGGTICKRRGHRGLFCHRFWRSQAGHRFWGYTVGPEGLWKSGGMETFAAFVYPGRIAEEQEDSQHYRPHRIREYGPSPHHVHHFRATQLLRFLRNE